jgi:hypothetical protein
VVTTHTTEKRKNLQVVSDFLTKVGGRTSPIPSLEEDNFRMREGFQRFNIELVETENPGKSFLEASAESEHKVDFFASSLQRTQLVGHYYTEGQEIPLHYVIVSSLILQRKDRVFHAWERAVKREYILAPLKFLPNPEELKREFTADMPVILDDSGGNELNYTQLRIAAVNRARELKWETRQELMGKWTTEVGTDPRTVMVLNDSLLYNHNDELTPSIIGFLRMVYVPFEGKDKLANHLVLPEFTRGQLFRIVDPEHKENTKYSWFLKLRGAKKSEPEYGLVRLEMLASNDEEAKRRADDLSALMVRERFPVTFPAPQWDKLIFPHKLCDQYLNSLVPSSQTIQAYFLRD